MPSFRPPAVSACREKRSGGCGRGLGVEFRKLHEEQHAVLDDLEFAAGVGGIDAERRVRVEHLARPDVSNRAALDEQQLGRSMPIDLVPRSARRTNLPDVYGALAERRHVLKLEAGVVRREPSEAVGIYDDRLFIAGRRILDGMPVDVLPDCLVAVLANDAAVGGRASKDAAVESA